MRARTQFEGQLEALLFQGLLGPRDSPTPPEGAPDSRFHFFVRLLKLMTVRLNDPVDELWLCHRASGLVIAGENLAWYYPAEQLRAQPLLLRSMLKPDQMWIWPTARKVGDAGAVAASWRQILTWPCRTLLTYHDPATVAFTGDGRAALESAARQARQL